jgi:hypothetical protein
MFKLSDPIISQDVLDVIKQLKPKHSLDPNNLSMVILKSVANEICMPLKHIVNLSLCTGEIPIKMKTAKVAPIFKSGDPTQWWANLDQASKDLDKTIFRDLSPTPIP